MLPIVGSSDCFTMTIDDVDIAGKELDLAGAIEGLHVAGTGTYDVIHIVVVCTRTEVITPLAGSGASEGFFV